MRNARPRQCIRHIGTGVLITDALQSTAGISTRHSVPLEQLQESAQRLEGKRPHFSLAIGSYAEILSADNMKKLWLSQRREKHMQIWNVERTPRFHPSEFTTDRYRGMNVINFANRCPVIIMASETCNPPHYRVIDGMKEMFYLSYVDAVAYCRRNGYLNEHI